MIRNPKFFNGTDWIDTVAKRYTGTEWVNIFNSIAYPLDIFTDPTPFSAYSIARKLKESYTGPLVKIRRISDNALLDFSVNNLGELDTLSISTWLGVSGGLINTLYDQSGNGHNLTAPASSNEPLYALDDITNKPTMHLNVAGKYLVKTTGISFTRGDWTVFAVGLSDLSGAWGRIFSIAATSDWNSSSGAAIIASGDTNSPRVSIQISDTGENAALPTRGFMTTFVSRKSGTNLYLYGGGSENSRLNTPLPEGSSVTKIGIGVNVGSLSDGLLIGKVTEVMFWTSYISDISSVLVNQQEFYSLSVPKITWQNPITISGDSDVSTDGILVFAQSFTAINHTVNGVTFAPNNRNRESFNFTNDTTSAYYSSSSPFISLPTAYRTLLQGGVYSNGDDTIVTIDSLVPGVDYMIQLWVSDPRTGAIGRNQDITGDNTKNLSYNVNAAEGGVGVHIKGTFTATSSRAVFKLTPYPGVSWGASAQINALQLRTISLTTPIECSGFNVDTIYTGNNYSTITTVDSVGGSYLYTESANPTGFIDQYPIYIYYKFKLKGFDQNNTLQLANGQSGTLTLLTYSKQSSIVLLCLSGWNNSNFTGTINFTDNTSQSFSNIFIRDWVYGDTNNHIKVGKFVKPSTYDTPTELFKLIYATIRINTENLNKTVVSVTFNKASNDDGNNRLNILGMSSLPELRNVPLIITSGFNADLIGVSGSLLSTTSAGIDNLDRVFVAGASGFPSTSENAITVGGNEYVLYNFGSSNALKLSQSSPTGTLNFSTSSHVVGNKISLLIAASYDGSAADVTINYSSGSPDVFTNVAIPNWNTSPMYYTYVRSTGLQLGAQLGFTPIILDVVNGIGKKVTSISFTWASADSQSDINIFSVSTLVKTIL